MKTKINYERLSLFVLSWIIGITFTFIGFKHINLATPNEIYIIHFLFLIIGLFFLFLPFSSKIKIGSFLEFERKLESTKSELDSFKTEIRNQMSIISTNINTIGNLSNQVNVNIQGNFNKSVQEAEEKAKESGVLLYSEDRAFTKEFAKRYSNNNTFEKLIKLTDISPRAAVLDAWSELEFAIRNILQKNGIENANQLPNYTLIKFLTDYDFSEEEIGLINKLRDARNRAAHTQDFGVSQDSAERFVKLAIYVIDKLMK